MFQMLHGIRILDFSRLVPGALTTQQFADFGADVIKVERPPYGDYQRQEPPLFGEDLGYLHIQMNRNKRSLGVDWRTPAGMEVVQRLIRSADALFENFRPGALEGQGLGYEAVREINSGIVYCSLSGYGQDGPYRGISAHGQNIDALAGVLTVGRSDEGRPITTCGAGAPGVQWGALLSAMTIAFGIIQRQRSGEGCYLDISQWDAAVTQNVRQMLALANTGATWDNPMGPRYAMYETKDGREVVLSPIEERFWQNFCDAVDRPDLLRYEGYKGGAVDYAHYNESLREELAKIIASKTMDEWLRLTQEKDFSLAAVYRGPEMLDDPHLAARGRIIEHEHPGAGKVRLLTPAVKVREAAFAVERPAPTLGADTEAVLREVGYGDVEIAMLRESGAVAG